jgi:hypothetical protein
MTDEGHQRYESAMSMPRGAKENKGFLKNTMFLDEATFEITGKLSH